MNVSLRPDRSLLDSNFESYKLGLTPISVKTLPVTCGVHYMKTPDTISKQHIKAISNQNCLNCNPYSPATVVYIDANGSIIQLVVSDDVVGLAPSDIKYTFENWRQRQTLERKLYPTLSFASSTCCCLYDGIDALTLLSTKVPSSCPWKCMVTLKPPLVCKDAQLLDTLMVSSSDSKEACLHLIFASVGERTDDVPVKSKSSMFVTYLEWLAYSSGPASEWYLERHRRFVGTTFPDYVTFERDAVALNICAKRTFTLAYDSLNPIVTNKNSGDRTTVESINGSQDVAPLLKCNEHVPSQSPLLKWTQPSDEDRVQFCIEMDLNRLMLHSDNFENLIVKMLPKLVDEKEEYQLLQIELPAVDPGASTEIVFCEVLYGSVLPELEFSVNKDQKSLLIEVTKKDNRFWPRILHDVQANQTFAGPAHQSLCASEVEHLQDGPVAMSDDNANRGFVAIHPPFNIEQLEEVDLQGEDADDDLLLKRIESKSSTVTHQAYLSGHQWLFNVMSLRSDCATQHANTAVCLRHDVDGIVWLPVSGQQQPDSFHWNHTGTLQAFGYVLASKRDRRFVSCPLLFSDNDSSTTQTVANIPFVAVADNNKRIYIYRQPLSAREHGFGGGDTELRKRKSEGTDNDQIVHVAWQHVVNLPEDGMITGFVTLSQPYPACLACTNDNIYFIPLKL